VKRERWLPGTLFGRNVLLIAALIVVVQIGVTTVFGFTVGVQRLEGITRFTIQQAESIRLALDAMDRAQADRYIVATNAAGPTQIVRGDAPVATSDEPGELSLRFLNRSLAQRLPPEYQARWQLEPPHHLWLGVRVRGEQVWIGTAAASLTTSASTVLLAVAMVAGLLAFGGAYAIQHRLNRPLRRLIGATTQMAAGQAPQPLPEQGARELAALARSFNQMVESLARADRDRALMLASLSHDLRTPLTKLRFALEYVGPHCEPDMRALMERNIEAADRIIDQFIDFARYGRDEVAGATDLNTLAAVVVHSFDAHREPIALELGELPSLMLRPTAMQRLLANLLRNAIEYAGRDIVVRTAQTSDGFALSVLDRGPGIPSAEIERLKQPFTRLHAARSGPGGSGLGLAIVERVTRLHGGRFELLPRDGGGLEARVSLPAAAVLA
jgi:two-component system osmolarity sensor histidine kinase EnvZ